jgi:hypothetical protein
LEKIGGELFEADAAGALQVLLIAVAEGAVESGEAVGEAGEGVFVADAEGDALQELVEGDGGFALEGAGVGLVGLGDADGIDEDEAGLAAGVGGDAGEVDGAGAAAFHLLEVELGADVAQEEEALEGLDVGAGGDHVDGDGDAELGGGAEGFDDILGLPIGFVGDLFAEVVAFAEFFADEGDDVFGVPVGLGKDEGLGHPVAAAAGEEVGEEFFPEGSYHGADLVGDDDGAVELGFGDGFFLVLDGPAFLAGEAVALLVVEAGVEGGAAFGDLGLYLVDVVADVDAIGDGLDVWVFGDEVAVEEAEGGLGGSGGEADEEGVELVEDLPPEVVDGAVAFVDDDDVEGLDGDAGVVGDGKRLIAGAAGAVELGAGVFVGLVVELGAFELREEALDGGDGDLADGIDAAGAEHLDVVEVGELAAVVGGGELLEFVDGMRLAPACLMRRYAWVTAVQVLPEPVAIWRRARGRLSARDFSSFVMAETWQSLRGAVISSGKVLKRARRVSGCWTSSRRCSGVWKAKTGRERESGSRWSRKFVSTPVVS